jgi:hypothetical protein
MSKVGTGTVKNSYGSATLGESESVFWVPVQCFGSGPAGFVSVWLSGLLEINGEFLLKQLLIKNIVRVCADLNLFCFPWKCLGESNFACLVTT